MANGDYKSTPLLYEFETIDHFIPEALKQVKILKSPPFTRDFVDLEAKFREVVQNLLGMDVSFQKLVGKVYDVGKRITVIVDDHTRPNVHTKILLSLLLNKLSACGVRDENIGILVATGTHREPTDEELEKIFGSSIYAQWSKNVVIHNCDENCRFIGETCQKTPIYIDENILNSCLVIPLTDSEYHYFAGQAGTVKSFCPGITGRDTTGKNHPKMFDRDQGFNPECRLGNTRGNPVIQEMKEVVEVVKKQIPIFGIDAIVSNSEIVYLNAGDLIALHEAARNPLKKLKIVEVDKPGDLVFVSLGGLGLNLYQARKGFHAGWNAVRKDGRGWIVILAPCKDGVGNEMFYQVMYDCKDKPLKEATRYVIDSYCTEETFQIGNQKPVDLLRVLLTVGEGNLKILTEMDPKELKEVFHLNAIPRVSSETPQETLRRTVLEYLKINPNPVIYILQDADLLVKVSGIP